MDSTARQRAHVCLLEPGCSSWPSNCVACVTLGAGAADMRLTGLVLCAAVDLVAELCDAPTIVATTYAGIVTIVWLPAACWARPYRRTPGTAKCMMERRQADRGQHSSSIVSIHVLCCGVRGWSCRGGGNQLCGLPAACRARSYRHSPGTARGRHTMRQHESAGRGAYQGNQGGSTVSTETEQQCHVRKL